MRQQIIDPINKSIDLFKGNLIFQEYLVGFIVVGKKYGWLQLKLM